MLDLTGQRYGKLVVVKEGPRHVTSGGRSERTWECKCDCGNTKIIPMKTLRKGTVNSCGCNRISNIQQQGLKQKKDLLGQRFGKLLVIQESEKRTSSGEVKWICACDCGNTIEIAGVNLTRKREPTISCGCTHSRGEEKIIQLLLNLQIPFSTQQSFSSCRFPDTNCLAKFDFYIDNQILLEYDGIQHSENVEPHGFFTKSGLEQIRERDQYKTNWCANNNIPLIRISYDKYDKLNEEYLLQLLSHYGYKVL